MAPDACFCVLPCSAIDQRAVYTTKHVRSLRGDENLRKHAIVPKDLCIALSQDTRGSFFNSLQWLDSKPRMQKRFVDVMMRLFAKKAAPSKCQTCQCVADGGSGGMSVCRSCEATSSFYSVGTATGRHYSAR